LWAIMEGVVNGVPLVSPFEGKGLPVPVHIVTHHAIPYGAVHAPIKQFSLLKVCNVWLSDLVICQCPPALLLVNLLAGRDDPRLTRCFAGSFHT
jgi:hypothetical protein